jgi:signal transduction histidine kinase
MKKIIRLLSLFVLPAFTAGAQSLNVDSLITLWHKAGEDTGKVILSRMIAGTLRQTRPEEGIRYGTYGAMLSRQLNFDKGTAGCYLNVSACYTALGNLNASLAHIDTAIHYSLKAGDENRLALVYLNRADCYMQLQHFDQSLKDCDTSLMYAERVNSDDRRARVLQTFGSIYFFQELYEQSEQYYHKANDLYKKINNRQMSAIVLNNLALVHKHTNRYDAASENIRQSIAIAYELADLNNLGMYYGTLSDIHFRRQSYPDALRFADSAMHYGRLMKNDITIGSAWEYLGQIYARQGKSRAAISALNNGYSIFHRLGDIDRVGTTAGVLAETYAAAGDFKRAFDFLAVSHAANDTLAKRRYQKDIAAMQTRFRVGEKDKEIQLLDKNRQLQVQQLGQQRTLLFAAIAVALLAVAAAALLISRNRLRQQMKELRLRNEIAADLHDEVGSSLSSIHMLSEMVAADAKGEKAVVIDKMRSYAKETMEKMGDIVWMIKPAEEEDTALKDRMQAFLRDVCDSRRIAGTLHTEELDRLKLSTEQRKAVYLVFKEAVNNAAKYALASRISVKVVAGDRRLQLIVEDDGIGFDETAVSRGNGLENMANRARELGGAVTVTSASGQGTRIGFSIPV